MGSPLGAAPLAVAWLPPAVDVVPLHPVRHRENMSTNTRKMLIARFIFFSPSIS
jgi:hypothetical protein